MKPKPKKKIINGWVYKFDLKYKLETIIFSTAQTSMDKFKKRATLIIEE